MDNNTQCIFENRVMRIADVVLTVLVIVMILYQLYYIRARPYEPSVHAIVHLGLAIAVITISMLKSKCDSLLRFITMVVMFILGVGVCGYFYFAYSDIMANPSYPPDMALYLGVVGAVIAIILSGLSFGWVFPTIIVVGILYVFFGNLLSGPLSAPSTTLHRGVVLLFSDVTSPWGLYGSLLNLSANYLFLFITFGSLLHAFGAMRFVQSLGNLVAASLKSGAAAMAIITSALLGSITGSSVANVTVTGSFTIPLMKKGGYTAEQSAAIESAASNGGQFLPPIMGATVFVMAAFTGLRYLEIAVAAIIPALLYFIVLLIYAELNAGKMNFKKTPYTVSGKELLMDAPIFIIPFVILISLMSMGYSLMYVIFVSIIALVVLGIVYSLLRKEARLKWEEMKAKLTEGVVNGSKLAIILAAIGIFVAVLEVTGLSINLSIILGQLAGDNLHIMLILVMVTSIILGIGVPTPAAYIVVATILSPSLIQMGVPLLQAHLFPLFFAIISHLTPPVGIALLIACNIANSHYYRSALETLKAAYPCLLLPFAFIYSPALLLQYETSSELVLQVVGVMIFFVALSILLINYLKGKLSLIEKGVLLIAVAIVSVYVFAIKSTILIAISLLLLLFAIYSNIKRINKMEVSET